MSSLITLIFFFETGYLTEPASPALELQVCVTMPGFYVGSEVSNSILQAYMASSLPPELSTEFHIYLYFYVQEAGPVFSPLYHASVFT